MRRLDRFHLRTLIHEEAVRSASRLDEGWLELLGDVGMRAIMTGPGRKAAAGALRGVASVLILPTKIDDAILNAVGADKQGKLRQVAGALTDVSATIGGLIPAAKVLEGLAKFLEGMSDEQAALFQTAAGAMGKKAA